MDSRLLRLEPKGTARAVEMARPTDLAAMTKAAFLRYLEFTRKDSERVESAGSAQKG
jgi:hypothetical protein